MNKRLKNALVRKCEHKIGSGKEKKEEENRERLENRLEEKT